MGLVCSQATRVSRAVNGDSPEDSTESELDDPECLVDNVRTPNGK